jgi:hypothetical protein
MSIETTKGFQVLNVPKTPEGDAFRKQLGKYLNHQHFRMKARGRGKRPTKRHHDALPLPMSEWVAVYVDLKEGTILDLRNKALSAEQQAGWQKSEIARLKAELETAKRTAGSFETLAKTRGEEIETLRKAIADNAETMTDAIRIKQGQLARLQAARKADEQNPKIIQEGKTVTIKISVD